MSDNQWEDYCAKADYSCDPYTYYFLWSNFGTRKYNFDDISSPRSCSGFSLGIGFLILLLLSIFGI